MRTRLALYVWALDPARTLTAPATPWSEPRRSRGPNGTSPFGSAGRGRAPLSRFGGNATTVRRSRAAPHGLGGLKDMRRPVRTDECAQDLGSLCSLPAATQDGGALPQ